MSMIALGWMIGLALGKPQPETNLDLKSVIEASLKNSTELRSARENLNIAHARVNEQSSFNRPTVGFTGVANRYDAKTNIAFGTTSFEALGDHLEILELAIRQAIDLSGQIHTGINQARLNELASQFDVTTLTHARILDAKVAYYNLLRAKHGLEVAEANLTAAKNQGKVTKQQIDAGVGQPIDGYRANTQIADAERQVARARNANDIARSELNDRIGQPLDAILTLVEAPNDPSKLEIAPISAEAKEELSKSAVDHRPEVKAASLALQATQKGIKLAERSQSPSLSVGLSGNYYPTFSFAYPRQATTTLSVSLSFPIVDGGLARARVSEAKAQVASASARLEQVNRNVRLDVERATIEVDNARKSLTAANTALEQATAARRLAQSRYENGVGIYLEITDTQAALVAAQTAQVNAVYDLLIAQAQLEYAVGQPTRG